MNKMLKTLMLGAALCAGGVAVAEGGDYRRYDPEAGWQANVPAFESAWIPSAGWGAHFPPMYPVEVGFPGLGDWNIGIKQPPRHGGGEVRCAAIGCEGSRNREDDIIRIGDCNTGPC